MSSERLLQPLILRPTTCAATIKDVAADFFDFVKGPRPAWVDIVCMVMRRPVDAIHDVAV